MPGQVWDRELLEEIADVAGVDETTVRRNVRWLVGGIGEELAFCRARDVVRARGTPAVRKTQIR